MISIPKYVTFNQLNPYIPKRPTTYLTMQEAQQLFNEKIANGTMTKEELENTPTCLRHFDEAEDAILKADQDLTIQTEVRSVLDSVVNQVIDLPPPLFGPRPMTIGGSSIFRDPNYDCDGNPIDREEDFNEKDARELTATQVEDLKPPKGLKRNVAQVLCDEEDENNDSWCTLM